MFTPTKTKTPTITVEANEAFIRANGHPEATALIKELPSRAWRPTRSAWAVPARHTPELAELISLTGARVKDPEGVLDPNHVAPISVDPMPFYWGTKSPTTHEAWEVGQLLRVSVKDCTGTGIMKEAGVVKVNPEGNAWVVLVKVSLEKDEHLGKVKFLSLGWGRQATESEVAAHVSAEKDGEVFVVEPEPKEALAANEDTDAKIVNPWTIVPYVPEACVPEPGVTWAPYTFSEMNVTAFPSWEVGSLIQASAPVLEPTVRSFAIDIDAPGSTWIRIETLRQRREENSPRSEFPYFFLTSCSARLATEDEISAHLKVRSPKS